MFNNKLPISILVFFLLLQSFALFGDENKGTYQELENQIKAENGKAKIVLINRIIKKSLAEKEFEKADAYLASYDAILNNSTLSDYADYCLNKGLLFFNKFDYKNGMNRFLEMQKTAIEIKDLKREAVAKHYIGLILFKQGDLEEAEKYFNESLEMSEGQEVNQATMTHKSLGDLFLKKEIFGKAKQHYKRAFDLLVQAEDLNGAAEMATQLGRIAYNLDDFEGAMVYFNTSREIYNTNNDEVKKAENLWDISKVYQSQDNIDQALEANNEALEIWKNLNDKYGKATTYLNIANNYIIGDKDSKAVRNLDRAAEVIKQEQNNEKSFEVFKGIAIAYEKLGKFQKAYQYHILYDQSKSIAFTKEKTQAIHEMKTKYNSQFSVAKQEQTITSLKMQKENDNNIKNFLLGIVGLATLLAFTMWRSVVRKKKDNVSLNDKNREIRIQKSEIDKQNELLEYKNESLHSLNNKLLNEISERESIEKTSFARDQFLAGMSHEMRTPMNALVGISYNLLNNEPKKEQVEQLENMQFSANNLSVFINDILDFSKIEAGKLTFESRAFEPKKLFTKIYKRFNQPTKDKGIGLSFTYDERIPEKLLGDQSRMNQILSNILHQSLENTETGKIDLEVYLEEYNSNSAVMRIKVSDTGNPVNSKFIQKMMNESMVSSSSDVFEGYQRQSMGLKMAKRLVDLQNGKMEVNALQGKGTEYMMTIPFKINKMKNNKAETTNQKAVVNLEGLQILIVEDNKINQLVVAKMLNDKRIKTVTALNGVGALQAMNKDNFDLVLMDIQMPIMDGYKTTAEIRSMEDPNKSEVPIIALTASAFLSEAEKAKLFGMNDHVGKPFSPEELMEKIHNCLNARESSSTGSTSSPS